MKEYDEKIMQEVRNLGLKIELVEERTEDSMRIFNHEKRITNLEDRIDSEMMIHS